MGTSRLVTYTVQYTFDDKTTGSTPCEWKVKYQGRPTVENLKKDMAHFEASCLPGGCNAHLGQLKVVSAFIRDQRNGKIVAEVSL